MWEKVDMAPDRPLSRILIVVLIFGLTLSVMPPIAAGQTSEKVIGRTSVAVSSPQATFEASSSESLAIDVSVERNLISGGQPTYEQEVSTARNVRLKILEDQIDAPIDVSTGTQTLGSLGPNAQRTSTFDIEIGDAEPGTYRIPVQVEYIHTRVIEYGGRGADSDITRAISDREQTKFVTITIEDKPQFDVTRLESDTVLAGDNGLVEYQITNTGTRRAADATVSFSVNNPGLFFGRQTNPSQTTTRYISALQVNETRSFAIRAGASRDVPPGTYPLSATVEYENTNGVTERSDPMQVGIRIGEERSFTLQNVTTSAFRVDEPEATITGRILNEGPSPAQDVAVQMAPRDTEAIGIVSGETAVGDLGVNESKPVSFTVRIPESVQPGSKSFDFTVEYGNQDGDVLRTDTPLRESLAVAPEDARFSLRNVSTSAFRVDEPEATITASIVNERAEPVRNVVAQLAPKDTTALTVVNGETAIGTLDANEAKPVSFTVSIPESAEPSSKSFEFNIEYEEQDGDLRTTRPPLKESLAIGPEQDRFTVAGVNTSVAAGGSDQLQVELRYTGSEPVNNVNARLFTSDPLSSADDGAYLGTVEPGDVVTAPFQVSASGDALTKEYDSAVEIRYEEADGDTRFTGSLSVGIPVEESSSGGLPLLPVAIGGVVLAGGGAIVIYRRYT
jgi:hypothetical protein